MTAPKTLKTTTAIARILTLPLMVGTLASCGYASRLPDAPSSLGYELADKPPSVTSTGELKRLPPPPISQGDAFADLSAPIEYRTGVNGSRNTGLELPIPKSPEAPVSVAMKPKNEKLKSLEDIAFTPLEFEAVESKTAQVDQQEFIAPPVQNVALATPVPSYSVPSYSAPAYSVPSAPVSSLEPIAAPLPAPAPVRPITYESAPIHYETVDAGSIYSESLAPLETVSNNSYAIGSAPSIMVESIPAPVSAPRSPVAIRSSRMANGAIINVHPIIGTPGNASSMLASTLMSELGTPVSEDVARGAQVAFDLRGRADRNTDGYVGVEWTLQDKNGNTVGTFREHQNGIGWNEMSDDVLAGLGRRVADRIGRNGALRQATLYAAANSPTDSYFASAPMPNRTFILEKGANLASAPIPVLSPRRRQVAYQSQGTSPYIGPITTQSFGGSQAAPYQQVTQQSPPPTYAPTPRVRSKAPRRLSEAPAPSFNTLRAPGNTVTEAAPTVHSGPRPLVFQGVSGAPGDGDQSLSREVARLLRDSGANVSTNGGPGALFLTAQVSKTPTANADRIEIVWRVSDSAGNSIGQVTQANDVPRGMLDSNWGEDAHYAAEGARDGIMQLLQSSGALDS